MGLKHKLPIIQRLRREVELRGYCLAQTNRGFTTTCRVYRSERDLGKPERAIHSVDTFNRWTVPDALGAIMEMEYGWKTGGVAK